MCLQQFFEHRQSLRFDDDEIVKYYLESVSKPNSLVTGNSMYIEFCFHFFTHENLETVNLLIQLYSDQRQKRSSRKPGDIDAQGHA